MSEDLVQREDLAFHRYTLHPDEPVPGDFVMLYRKVFADPPWDEHKKCSQCIQSDARPKKFSRRESDALRDGSCPDCGMTLVDYWSDEHIVEDIRGALLKKNPSCYFLRRNGELIGFAYGREYSYAELEDELKLAGLGKSLENAFGKDRACAYQDEIAIASEHQRRGYAKHLFQLRLRDFRAAGMEIGVVRTKTIPQSVTFSWYVRLGYGIVSGYGDKDARVVLARDLAGLNL